MRTLDSLSDLLQSHADRDKVVCLTSYVLKLWGASANKPALLAASARLAAARAALRLYDDCAALKAAVAYGFGTHEGPFWGTLGVAGSSSTILYLQAEKIVFLIDCGLIHVSKEFEGRARLAHKLFWVMSASIGLIRSIRGLHTSAKELKTPSPRKCAQARFSQASLLTTKLISDVIHSVSWLPEGWLWGSKLTPTKMGAIATLSASIALVMHYHGKRLAPKR